MPQAKDLHPPDTMIEAYALGRLTPAHAARLEEHFLHCERCGAKLGQVAGDTYCDLIRDVTSVAETAHAATIAGDFPELPAELRTHARYTIQRKLGAGGMGVVYQAMHRVMQRPVALKSIRPDLLATPMAVTRFRREVQTAARLAHPNIVTAFDAEEVAGVHFLVMEYVEGSSLEMMAKERGPLPVAVACDMARQIALGLEHAHAQGMVHRDIKPANIMVTPAGAVKILDFGLASWSSEQPAPALTQTGARLGTMYYAAPEQLQSAGRVDARADQFGLGATLYFLLTGKPPHPLDFAQLPATVNENVRQILRRLLASSPGDRFPSAQAAADALAKEASPVRPRRPIVTRRRTLVAGAAFLLVLAGVAGWLKWGGGPKPLPVLFVLPSQGLWFEDYGPARAELTKAGIEVRVATPGGQPSRLHENSMGGKPERPVQVAADLDLRNAQAHDYRAILCVGFRHDEFTSGKTEMSQRAQQLLRDADRAERWLVGICTGQYVLGSAGVLQGKRVAKPSQFVSNPASMGGIPQADPVVIDGRIITGSTSTEAAPAAAELVRQLTNPKR